MGLRPSELRRPWEPEHFQSHAPRCAQPAQALPAFSSCQQPPRGVPTSTAGGGEGGGPELGETCCCQERAHTEVPQAEPGEGAGIWLPKEVWGELGVAHSPFYLVKQNSQKNAPKGGQSVRERPPVGAGTWVWPSPRPQAAVGLDCMDLATSNSYYRHQPYLPSGVFWGQMRT